MTDEIKQVPKYETNLQELLYIIGDKQVQLQKQDAQIKQLETALGTASAYIQKLEGLLAAKNKRTGKVEKHG